MALSDLFPKPSSQDPLAQYDVEEATNLPLHVRQCGRRYAALKDELGTLKWWFIILIAVLIITRVIDVNEVITKALP